MKYFTLSALLLLSAATMAQAQTDATTGATTQAQTSKLQSGPFVGRFSNKQLDIDLDLNLYDKKVIVPGYEDEPSYGFLRGKINGLWMVMKVKKMDEKQAVVRMASEIGADAVDVRFKALDDGAVSFEHIGDVGVKAVQGSKYVKLPKVVVFDKVR
mgnify:CR=1 FL=1